MCQSNELMHNQVIVQRFWPLPPTVPVANATAPGAGQAAVPSLPTEVAAVITKKTSFAGRKYRGRVYVGGIPNTGVANSQLVAAQMTNMNTLAAALGPALIQGGYTFLPIIWHKATKTNDTISACQARPIVRSQRRRQVGKGH